ncbi:MFS transporter [Pseudomonas sp. EL_65y_Pfl2_R95]|uniref:MFS transporter n=1 Tax=Pseudomonas sp. EL_65y_Pfl2_R95 TaxID=3088698 RepID=UPI0030DAE442
MNALPQRSTGHTVAAITGLLVLSIALRPAIVSIGPVLLQIQHQFSLSYAQAALLTSIPDVCMAVFALIAPRIAKRLGADQTVIAALVLLGLAIVIRALSQSSISLLFSTVLVGVGIAIGGALIGGWIKTHFANRASFYMGIYAAGLSVGATVAAVSTESITLLSGTWRVGAGVWSLLCVGAVISWWVLARMFATHSPAPTHLQPVNLPWFSSQAWLVALYFGGSQFIVYALFAWLAPAARDWDIGPLSPGALLGVFTSVFAVASFLMGALAGPSRNRCGWLITATVMTALGAAGLYMAPHSPVVLFVIVTAVGLGMAFTLAMTLPLDNVHTAADANAWTVFMLFIGYLIAALGPIAFGYLREHSNDYRLSFLLLLVVSLVLLCLTPLLKPDETPSSALSAT